MLRTRSDAGSTGIAPLASGRGPVARLALLVAALAVFIVSLARWVLALRADLHSIAGRYDFSTYYAAAAALRTNLHANIYDAGVLARAGDAARVLVRPPLPYTYPPLFAILLSPFTRLSFRVLSRVWLVGNAALWLTVALILAVELRALVGDALASPDAGRVQGWLPRLRADPAPLVAAALAAWLCLSFAPGAQTLGTGQINFLVLAPLALIPWLSRHGHERGVGMAVAIAAMLKLTPALLLIYLALRRRWEALIAALVALAALALLSALLVGPGVLLAALPQALRVGTGDAALGHNEALFAPALTALRLAQPGLAGGAALVTRLLIVALALALGVLLWRTPHPTVGTAPKWGVREAAGYGVALCAMLLLSPAAWVHHYVWLLPPAAIALGIALRQLALAMRSGRAGAAFTLALVTALACVALGWGLPYGWDTEPQPAVTHVLGLPLWPLALELRPLGALVLLLALAWWHVHPEEAPATPAAAMREQL